MSKKLLVIDADTILYSSAAQQQLTKCLATNIEYNSKRMFESKTAFNEWLKTAEGRTKDMYTFESILELKPDAEPRFAFNSIIQKIDNIIEATGLTDFKICIEGGGNFRKDYPAKFVDYKGQRSEKPLLFEECRYFVLRKYKDKVIESVGIETDDTVNQYAWESWRKVKKTGKQSSANVVIAQVDKDIPANGRGFMFNYFKPETGVFWNDGFTQAYNFATQLLTGDGADNIPGIEKLSEITRERFAIKTKGVGPATAVKLLADCKTQVEIAQRVFECYSAAWEDWDERLSENGFFLYLLRDTDDKWSMDKYLEGVKV